MLMLLSPAKTLDYESRLLTARYTQPELISQASELVAVCRQLTPAQLGSLMSISDKLAGLNAARFAQWQPDSTLENSRQALLAFKGDVYTGLAVEDFSEADLEYAQSHLRILSGLYGLLRPLDLMQPYRLEMGSRLANPRGKDLYAFWGESLTDRVNTLLASHERPVLLNLASEEYFKSLHPRRLQWPCISPLFQDEKAGKYKIISFYAKRARGLMARYLIKQRLDTLEGLTGFNLAGYRYCPELSTPEKPLFRRSESAAQAMS